MALAILRLALGGMGQASRKEILSDLIGQDSDFKNSASATVSTSDCKRW
jgi:hypothetical protein